MARKEANDATTLTVSLALVWPAGWPGSGISGELRRSGRAGVKIPGRYTSPSSHSFGRGQEARSLIAGLPVKETFL